MTQASCKTTINISADNIWQAISEFGAAGQSPAGVVACTVEGAGDGALLAPTSADGSMVVERLDALERDTRQVSDALLTVTPFRNCRTTMAVRNLRPNQAELELSISFF